MYKEIAANKRKTFFMMGLFVLLVTGMGWLFAQYAGEPALTPFVLLGAGIYAFISYLAGSRMALAFSGAKEIQKNDNPRLWRIVENLAITNGMPMPKVYIIEDPAPNAMATGRDPNHASVAATTGILALLTDDELQGVMAHEMGHIKNYDIRVSMIAFALVAVVSILADIMIRMTWFRDRNSNNNSNAVFLALGLVAAILAPLIAACIQMAISRRREYLADATGVMTTRYPEALASALEKIGGSSTQLRRQNASTAHLFFSNPLRSKGFMGMFSTHPPIEDRVAKLRNMGFDK